MNKISITNASGEQVDFDRHKLFLSLRKASASEEMAELVTSEVESGITNGITTKEIYKRAFSILRSRSAHTAARYKLKKAIMQLGETGFPFERFIGTLLEAEGFETQVGVIVQGKCVTHEVDVIAQKDELHYMCECKFHQSQERRCNVKIPLYINSRFKDVEAQWRLKKGHGMKFHQGWIFTNTRFTSDAIQYSECAGLQLISWDYPDGDAIKDRVNRTGVHPVTCLTKLTRKQKLKLIGVDIVTTTDILKDSSVLNGIETNMEKRAEILEEIRRVSQIQVSDE